MTYQELWHKLVPKYDPREAQAVVRVLLDGLFDMSLTDIVGGKVTELSAESQQLIEEKLKEIQSGTPVQYVLGFEWFAGRRFAVNPSVLIPRPETAELCSMIVADHDRPFCCLEPPVPLRVLDVGTGSGCIAVTLSLDIPNSVVEAWDISGDALLTARDNARRLHASVDFRLRDILDADALPAGGTAAYDVIVSNPPYICCKERATMADNVVNHEPGLALFVPDDDPLRFYSAIASYALRSLRKGGGLYFEVNALYAGDVAAMLRERGFSSATVRKDQFGMNRFVVATL